MINGSDVYYDPYEVDIEVDPYPVYRRLREEAPLYYNDKHDFFALSRYEDVERALADNATYISGRGGILELIKADIKMPSGVLIFEDPPIHTIHRRLLSRVFTPKKMNALEPQVREYCAQALDPLVGTGRFDFVADLGRQMPMRVIGMLLGIPLEGQEAVRDKVDSDLRTEPGQPQKFTEGSMANGEIFNEYIEWRAKHPSDDLMTQLMEAEFEDETGTLRRLTREELLTYLNVVAGAGNETTARLIGWAGKVLAEHPDQRRALVENPALVPNAVEELLRFEPPAHHIARVVTREVVHHGHEVPEGSIMMLLNGSANRDSRRFPDGDRFDVRREVASHLGFGYGIHFCLGAALARLEGRIALEEVLRRFPEWDVDYEHIKMATTTTVRGWDTLPTFIRLSSRGSGLHPPKPERRPYNSPIRRRQAAETRERIITAGAELLHGFPVWNWVALTVRAVAQRAGVNERTIYRHFDGERELRDAVLERLRDEAGVDLEGLKLEDLKDVATRIFEYVSSFPIAPRTPRDPSVEAENARQRAALMDALRPVASGWSDLDRTIAAATFDVLWSPISYERMVADWGLDPKEAIRGLIWVMKLVEDAIRRGSPPP